MLDIVELFDRLDVLVDQLRENADSWFLSGGGEVAGSILEARSELHEQITLVEEALTQRRFWGSSDR